jgi:cohesin loading factor subunit SCC2
MKCQQGIQLSYELQMVIQQKTSGSVIRGYRMPKEGVDEPPTAANGFVYSLLRSTKPNRRALIQSMTKQFDDQKATLSFMLFLADNLAYFPYAVQDEPLYLIHQIDLFISVQGTNLLQTFRDGLKKREGFDQEKMLNPLEDEDDEEDREALVHRLPEDTTELQQCITSAQGCMLLLILKQHLKEMYGLNDA